jgi:hypothetical protein
MVPVLRLTEAQRLAVVAAYRHAAASRKSTPDCYFAAIEALQSLYPDAERALVAAEAVRIVTGDVNFVTIARSFR